jgi:hypothetical protein
MKTYKEYLSEAKDLNEGPIWDFIKKAASSAKDVLVKTGKGLGQIAASPIAGAIRGLSGSTGGGGGSGGYYGSKYGSSSSKDRSTIKKLKGELKRAKKGTPAPRPARTTPAPRPAGTTPAPRPAGTTPAPRPAGTTPAPVGTTSAPKPAGTTPAPRPAGTTPAPVGTTSAPKPAGTTPAPRPAGTTPAPVGTTSAPTKILSKAEKKDRRELARTSGGITKRIGTIGPTVVSPSGSLRLFNHETLNNMKKAAANKLGSKYAAISKQNKKDPRGVRKGTTEKQLKAVNTTRALQLGKEVMQKSIANNPELANKLAAQRMRVASARAKQGKLMGFSESSSTTIKKLLNSRRSS